ncbi:YceI family protein [Gillisia marina]|uniref:YceI family protein n=1 Tax=Gillisia marina TaxID=1167637 RepID=UPI00029A8380|nr:YceI family protein [Gillisia marina]
MNQETTYFFLFITLLASNFCLAQELYSTSSAQVEFFSEAPIENIKADSNKGISVLNLDTGEIAFQVKINTFQFEKALMQEHFNENYMESEKFPKASFKGKITNLDIQQNTTQDVLIKGDLRMHGISRSVEIPAKLQLRDETLILESTFNVACEDYEIKIPKLLWKNIAEIIQVDLTANYKKY